MGVPGCRLSTGHMGLVLPQCNAAGPGPHALRNGRTSLIAHSPPDGRRAEPWSEEVAACPSRVARKARQISSLFTKGRPTGVNVPLRAESGLSQETCAPEPCGSRATASAALARRQSSSPSSGDRGDTKRGSVEAVVSGSSTREVIGKVHEQAPSETANPAAARSRMASPAAGTALYKRRAPIL